MLNKTVERGYALRTEAGVLIPGLFLTEADAIAAAESRLPSLPEPGLSVTLYVVPVVRVSVTDFRS